MILEKIIGDKNTEVNQEEKKILAIFKGKNIFDSKGPFRSGFHYLSLLPVYKLKRAMIDSLVVKYQTIIKIESNLKDA